MGSLVCYEEFFPRLKVWLLRKYEILSMGTSNTVVLPWFLWQFKHLYNAFLHSAKCLKEDCNSLLWNGSRYCCCSQLMETLSPFTSGKLLTPHVVIQKSRLKSQIPIFQEANVLSSIICSNTAREPVLFPVCIYPQHLDLHLLFSLTQNSHCLNSAPAVFCCPCAAGILADVTTVLQFFYEK